MKERRYIGWMEYQIESEADADTRTSHKVPSLILSNEIQPDGCTTTLSYRVTKVNHSRAQNVAQLEMCCRTGKHGLVCGLIVVFQV